MPASLSDDDIDEILETYQDIGTYKGVAEELGYDRDTVSKYVNEHGPLQVEDGDTEETEGPPEGFTAEPPSHSDPSEDPLENPDFDSMNEGEFIRWFFNNSGHGVRSNFAKNLAQFCRIRGQIPDKAEMAKRIMSQKSGIQNDADVEMIADNYWAAAKRWADANNVFLPGMNQPQQGGYSPGGEWVGANGQQQGGGQSGSGGNWVSASNGQQGQGQRGQQQGGYDQGQPQQNPPQYNQQSQRDSGQDSEIRELKEAVRELKNSQVRMMRQSQSRGDADEVQSLKDKFQEMVEIQRTLDQMQSENGGNQEVQAIKKQLAAMQEELQRSAQQQQEGGGQPQFGGDSEFAAFAQLATSGDVDPETLSVMADAMGVTDPEVKKAEFDYKKTQEKMKNRQMLMNQFFENLGEVSGDLFSGLFAALGNQGGDGQGNQQQGQPQQPQQQPQQQNGQGATAPAGSSNMQDGQIQVVGDGPDGQPQAPPEQSPAERRMAELTEQADQEPDMGGMLEEEMDDHFEEPESDLGGIGEFRDAGGSYEEGE